MRQGRFLVVAIGLFFPALVPLTAISPAYALPEDCTDPKPLPRMPKGDAATKDEMLAARQSVLDYQAQIEAILACWEKRRNFDFDVMNQDQQKRWNEDYDAINKMLETAQTNFNVAVRAFKAAHPAPETGEKPVSADGKEAVSPADAVTAGTGTSTPAKAPAAEPTPFHPAAPSHATPREAMPPKAAPHAATPSSSGPSSSGPSSSGPSSSGPDPAAVKSPS